MEDALISPAGFMILSGAGLIDATSEDTIKVHVVEQTDEVEVTPAGSVVIEVDQVPYTRDGEDMIYVMLMDNGEVSSEPYIPATVEIKEADDNHDAPWAQITLKSDDDLDKFVTGCVVLIDYYTEKSAGVQQINITPDKFGGNYYLEASTLFRDQSGVDHPAEFIIPNCKVQSNFTFTMAATGDPSTFTFTMDAFPDYTRFNKTKKVLAAIQVFDGENAVELTRPRTKSTDAVDDYDRVIRPTVGD